MYGLMLLDACMMLAREAQHTMLNDGLQPN
jgi:hypothetical protein